MLSQKILDEVWGYVIQRLNSDRVHEHKVDVVVGGGRGGVDSRRLSCRFPFFVFPRPTVFQYSTGTVHDFSLEGWKVRNFGHFQYTIEYFF